MSKAFRERSMEKYYLAIVAGHISSQDGSKVFKKDEKNNQVTILSEPSNDAKPIITEYRPLKLVGQVTLLEVHLITGRKPSDPCTLSIDWSPCYWRYQIRKSEA